MTIDREPMEQIAIYIVPAVCITTGLILLIAGGRLLKSAIGLSFGLVGAGAGLLIAPSLPLSISPLIIAVICGVVAAILAVGLAKLAILLTLGISFAVITPVITWYALDLGDGTKMVEDFKEAVTAADADTGSNPSNSAPNMTSTEGYLIATAQMVTHDVARTIQSGMRRANAAWDAIPTGPRLILVGSAIAGLLLGLLVATFMPYFASALVTAAGGSFLLIEGIRTSISVIWSSNELSSLTPTVMVGTFVGIALAGLGLQLTCTKKSNRVKATE